MPGDATGEGARPSLDVPPPLRNQFAFKIPKLTPPPPVSAAPSAPAKDHAAAAHPAGDDLGDVDATRVRVAREHKGTRKRKHLLVLDLNGLLVDRRMSAFVEPDGTKRAPDAKFGKFFIYNRPHMTSFVKWAFEHFTVGVWSSAQSHNAKALVAHIWGTHRDALAFVWGQDRCTHVGAMDPNKPNSKPMFLKDLNALWESPSYARFGPRNTLLLDDSPYKAVMNPPHTSIHPAEYRLVGKPANGPESRDGAPEDDVLGEGGSLREYLRMVAESEFVDECVASTPWRSRGSAAPESSEEITRKAKEGGLAVAAAVAAARAGRDANEIDLPSTLGRFNFF
jgi:hypothetical protein